MKNFTFVLLLLLLTSVVTAQQPNFNESSFQRFQDSYTRLTKLSSYFQKNKMLDGDGIKAHLKNAQALHSLDSIVSQSYDPGSEGWINESKIQYIYEDDLINTAEHTLLWNDTTETWDETARMEFTYDEAGSLTEIYTYEYDEATEELVLILRSVAFYDSENRLDSIQQYYTEDQTTWIDAGTIEYLYNDEGQLSQMVATSMVEEEGEEMEVTFQMDFSYNENSLLESYSMKMIMEGIELTMLEAEMFYDDSNRRTASEISAFNLLTSTLEKSARSEYEYNESDELIVESEFSWDNEQEEWVLEMKDEIAYNDLMLSDVVFPNYQLFIGEIDDAISSQHAIAEVTTYLAEEDTWSLSEKATYYYTEGPSTNVGQVSDNLISLYPNPFTDRIILSWKGHNQLSFELFSITGKKMIETMILPQQEIHVGHLKNGVYLYKLMDNKTLLQSGKLIKK